jgi:hypothetical protein
MRNHRQSSTPCAQAGRAATLSMFLPLKVLHHPALAGWCGLHATGKRVMASNMATHADGPIMYACKGTNAIDANPLRLLTCVLMKDSTMTLMATLTSC